MVRVNGLYEEIELDNLSQRTGWKILNARFEYRRVFDHSLTMDEHHDVNVRVGRYSRYLVYATFHALVVTFIKSYDRACGHHDSTVSTRVETLQALDIVLEELGHAAVPWTSSITDVTFDNPQYLRSEMQAAFRSFGIWRKLCYVFSRKSYMKLEDDVQRRWNRMVEINEPPVAIWKRGRVCSTTREFDRQGTTRLYIYKHHMSCYLSSFVALGLSLDVILDVLQYLDGVHPRQQLMADLAHLARVAKTVAVTTDADAVKARALRIAFDTFYMEPLKGPSGRTEPNGLTEPTNGPSLGPSPGDSIVEASRYALYALSIRRPPSKLEPS